MPLEGLWWVPDMSTFSVEDKSRWDWTMMIVQSAHVTADVGNSARETAARKKGLPAIERVRLERFAEGRAAQILHVGPYSHPAAGLGGGGLTHRAVPAVFRKRTGAVR